LGKYKIKFSKKAAKNYKKLPAGYKELVNKELMKFEEGSSSNIIPLEGSENIYRIRVGRYRVLLVLQEDLAIISEIRTRGDIYK